MKRSLFLKLVLTLMLSLALAFPVSALADMTVVLTNKTTVKISVALRYKDAVSNTWVTRGWWNVDPLSKRNVKISTNNTILYFHGTAGKRRWGGKQGDGSSVQHTVVSSKFLVKGDIVPSGNNRRNVWFKKATAKDRVFRITLVGN